MVQSVVVDLVTVVPVLNRPSRVLPLFVSWQASRAPGKLAFIVEVDDLDERIALEAVRSFHGVDVVSVVDAHTWPEKVCVAADVYKDADWLLFGADDVTFTPGWWQATKELREQKSVGVIGTNDMSNPRVLAGEHTTHPLMRGTYIDRWGTVDEPGVPVHAGYSHWYVDDELVWTAKMRDMWAFCEGAKVVHHHPYFDPNVAWDDTYAAGEANAAQDRKLFCERAPLFGVECG